MGVMLASGPAEPIMSLFKSGSIVSVISADDVLETNLLLIVEVSGLSDMLVD